MLITTRLSFLQQVQKSAINGYYYYETGTIHPEKLQSLINKFKKHYQVNQTRQQAYRQRKLGNASAKFYCYADETDIEGIKIFWVLLLTEGKHPATSIEKLKNLKIKKERFIYSDYKLIQKPRNDGKKIFTFSLTASSLEYYEQRMRKVVRNKNKYELQKLITHFNKMPGFSEIRVQRKKLNEVYKDEIKRSYIKTQASDLPKMTNFYHRHVAVDWIKNIKVFVQQLEENNRTVKQQLKAYRDNKNKRGIPKVPLVSIQENDSIVVITTPAKSKSILGKIFS